MQKIGIYAGMENHYSFEERIIAIKETGFTCVCLNFEQELLPTETSWNNQLTTTEKYAIPVQNAHLTGAGMNAIWQNTPEGEFVKNRLIEELKALSRLGIACGVAHVTWGRNIPVNIPTEIGLKRYEEIANIAEKYQVKLALENSVYPQFLRYVLDNIRSDYVGFCYDSGHEHAFSPNENFLQSYGNRLFAIHLQDNHGEKDEHLIPFDGSINWEQKIQELKKTGLFQSEIVLESISHGESLYEYLQHAFQAAKKLASL